MIEMTWSEYQAAAWTTAIYPNREDNVIYPLKGLAGELGEVGEHLKKIERDDGGVVSHERKAAITKELGDVVWYACALATSLGLSIDGGPADSVSDYASFKGATNAMVLDAQDAGHPIGGWGRSAADAAFLHAFAVAGGLAGSLFCRIVQSKTHPVSFKKMCLVNEQNLLEINSLLSKVVGVAIELDIDIQDVLQVNLDKLRRRAEQGKLTGSGSDR